MPEDRVSLNVVKKRLAALTNLPGILDGKWIAYEYKKPIEKQSIISGWLSKDWCGLDRVFEDWVKDVDSALGLVRSQVTDDVWCVVERKVQAHCDRSESRGILSEIAVWTFLAKHNIPFRLETELLSGSNRNVDVSADFNGEEAVHIEIQWISPSDKSDQGAAIASAYGETCSYEYEFDYESYRIKSKVSDKTSKLTMEDITLVALNCTPCPVLGGDQRFCPIEESVLEAFTGCDLEGNSTRHAHSDIDTKIRELVDGVIWFELEPGCGLQPVNRGFCLNPVSPHKGKTVVRRLVKAWNP